MTPKESLELTLSLVTALASAVAAGAVIFAIKQIKINRKQLYLSTISKCVADFQNLSPLDNATKDVDKIYRYIELTNEELFYFQHQYIPKEVSREWIDGMISFVPITDKNQNILNQQYCISFFALHRTDFLKGYPRIQNAFEVSDSYNFDLIYSTDEKLRAERVKERKRLIREVEQNIRNFNWFD